MRELTLRLQHSSSFNFKLKALSLDSFSMSTMKSFSFCSTWVSINHKNFWSRTAVAAKKAYTKCPSVSGKPIWWLKSCRFARFAFVASKLFMSWAALRWCPFPSFITIGGIGIKIDCIWRSLFTRLSWFCWFLFGSFRIPGGQLLGLFVTPTRLFPPYNVPAPVLTMIGIIFVVCVTSGGGTMLWFIATKLLFLLFNVLLRDAFMWFISALFADMLCGSVADATV